MASQGRDDQGQFSEKLRDQDLLLAFDFASTEDDPYLTVKEVKATLSRHFDIDVTDEAVRVRLDKMVERDQVAKREFGPAVAYRALAAPALDEDAVAAVAERGQAARDEFVDL